MILDQVNLEKLGKSYDQCGNRTKVHVRCDYCGREFMREKRQIVVSSECSHPLKRVGF